MRSSAKTSTVSYSTCQEEHSMGEMEDQSRQIFPIPQDKEFGKKASQKALVFFVVLSHVHSRHPSPPVDPTFN
jgi:hypothetical protein